MGERAFTVASLLPDVARKVRRALRNDTGVHFSCADLRALADLGMLERLQQAEALEIQSKWAGQTHLTSSGNSGSTSDQTANHPTGKSPNMTKKPGRSAIEALVAGM